MRGGRKVWGFTVLELAMVVTVSGIVLGIAADVAAPYVSEYRYKNTVYKMSKISSALTSYTNTVNRLPFPSDPTLSTTSNPNAGCECGLPCVPVPAAPNNSPAQIAAADQAAQAACAALLAPLPLGGCTPSGGICKVAGTHHTASNPNPNPAIMDPVYIGGVPYKSITTWINNPGVGNAALGDTLDAWGYQMNYAVSSGTTNSTSYKSGAYGVIDVKSETGVDFTPPVPPSTISVGDINYIIIDAGDNHMGAYTAEGALPVPCTTVAQELDAENCNRDSNFIQGLRSISNDPVTGLPLPGYFDDIVQFSSFSIFMLWDFTPTAKVNPSHANDIYNLNPGNVGVGFAGTATSPTEQLEIYNNSASGTLSVNSGNATQTQICDYNGNNCWNPNLLAGPATGANASNNKCPASTLAGYTRPVIGLVNGQVQCMADPGIPLIIAPLNQSCPAGHFVIGFNQATGLVCN